MRLNLASFAGPLLRSFPESTEFVALASRKYPEIFNTLGVDDRSDYPSLVRNFLRGLWNSGRLLDFCQWMIAFRPHRSEWGYLVQQLSEQQQPQFSKLNRVHVTETLAVFFNQQELQQFVERFYPDVVSSLEGSSPRQLAGSFVGILFRRGQLNESFRDHFLQVRPNLADRLEENGSIRPLLALASDEPHGAPPPG